MKRFIIIFQTFNVIIMSFFGFMMVLGVAFFAIFFEIETVLEIQKICAIIAFSGLNLYLITLFLASKYFSEQYGGKRLDADKYDINFKDYDKLHNYLVNKCKENGYKLCERINLEGNKSIEFYIKNKIDHFKCISIFRVSELEKETIDLISKLHDEFTDEYLNNSFKNFYASFITILVVDRKTEAFDYLINSEYADGHNVVHVPVGISLGGKNMYISKMKGMMYRYYKKSKKEFLEMMGIEE